ncbi:MAG: carboxypeptidase-like regulatory domain-containing protein [Candidatus Cybelea sp.]
MFAVLLALSQFFFWPSPIDWQMNQQNVVVRGTVVDATGHPVPDVPVYAASDAFGARTVSDSKGQFIFLTLFPGTYNFGVSQSRYANVYGLSDSAPPQLFAGFEYGATIVLSPTAN